MRYPENIGMSESFSNDEIEEIILDNKDLVEERKEPFGVDGKIKLCIFPTRLV